MILTFKDVKATGVIKMFLGEKVDFPFSSTRNKSLDLMMKFVVS